MGVESHECSAGESRHDLGGTAQYEVLRAEQQRDLIDQVLERWWHRFSRWLVQARPIPKLTYRNEAAQALTRWRAEEDRFAKRWAGTSHTWTANDLIDGETAPDRIVNGDDLV